jgi:hypothetical protein
MARTLTEIYDLAAQEKANLSSLDGLLVDPQNENSLLDNSQILLNQLSTPSKVANWRLILWVISFCIWVHETLWDLFKAEIEQQIAAGRPGVPLWYQQQAFNWQFGQDLVWDGNRYVYDPINLPLRLVTRCSINDEGGIIRVKVAKGLDAPSELSIIEEASFTAYMNQIKFAGSNLQVINYPADQIRCAWEIFYNPLLQPSAVRANVEAAINNYLRNIPFDGKLVLNAFIDAVQAAEGVVNPILLACDTNNISSAFAPVNIEYQSVSGYFIISPANPLTGYYNTPTNTIEVIKLTPYV